MRSQEHLDSAVVTRPQKDSFSRIYSMHKYWSKKPPDVIAEYISCYTERGDIVLDPFSGSGVTACEAIRLGRKAIAIDLNPMAIFIAKATLTPVSLPRLQWAFEDIEKACQQVISELYTTKCRNCGSTAEVEFFVRHDDDPEKDQVAYTCSCSHKRQFANIDQSDKLIEYATESIDIPYWFPDNVRLPFIQKERFDYLHQLFSRRNLVVLSTILHSINAVEEESIRNVLKLTFTAALDKCSRLKPLAKGVKDPSSGQQVYSLSQGWVAVRFYAPTNWQEVNPWSAFSRSFSRVYTGKVESNALFPNVIFASSIEDLKDGDANILLVEDSSDDVLRNLPSNSIDYILTDPPLGEAVQYLSLSSFWGAWLGMNPDYEKEIIVFPKRGKLEDEYNSRLLSIFTELGRLLKENHYLHVMFHELHSPYMHTMMGFMVDSQLYPERIVYQPPTNSFVAWTRSNANHSGSYIVRALASSMPITDIPPTGVLSKRIAELTYKSLEIRGGEAPIRAIQHSVYQQLESKHLIAFVKQSAKDFLLVSIEKFARLCKGNVVFNEPTKPNTTEQGLRSKIREAILDVKSLLAGESDIHNRMLQRVLHRFQKSGITLDDILAISKEITEIELKSHQQERMARFVVRLLNFGLLLGFECEDNPDTNIVSWKKDGIWIDFSLNNNNIEVILMLPDNMKSKSTWGTLAYMDLEIALWNWCVKNEHISGDLKNDLNPPETSIHNSTLSTGNNQCRKLRVLGNDRICKDHFMIRLELPSGFTTPNPGQFFHVICDPNGVKDQHYPLALRRPFSIHGTSYNNFQRCLLSRSGDFPQEIRDIIKRQPSEISFLYKVVGQGTNYLTDIRIGDYLDIIGPCGHGFKIGNESCAVLVAGGIGAAPLVALAEHLRYLGTTVHMYLGALNSEFLAPALCRPDQTVSRGFVNGEPAFRKLITDEFLAIGASNVYICTDDGSEGQQGLVTDILSSHFENGLLPSDDVCVYACGPHGMLKAIHSITKRFAVKCQVLMEERMACGIGACMSCTCKIDTPNGIERKRVCKDGPVFDAHEVRW